MGPDAPPLLEVAADLPPIGTAIPPTELSAASLIDEIGVRATWEQNDPQAGFFVLYWRAREVETFDLDRQVSGSPFVVDVTLRSDRGFLPGTTYEFAVQVFALGEYSPLSNVASATTCSCSPVAGINALIANVERLVLDGTIDGGPGGSLVVKLENALVALENDRPSAEHLLGAFAAELGGLVGGQGLPPALGRVLIGAANATIEAINIPSRSLMP